MLKNFDFRIMKEICLKNWNKGLCGSGKCECKDICDKILKENILPKDFAISIPKEEKIYSWIVTEEDGYTYCESGSAYDIIEAAWKACEYSTDSIQSISVAKISKN